MKLSLSDLRQRQSLPLEAKIWHSQKVIREWYDLWRGHVYVSFSGGLDSLVLRHIVLDLYKDVECVFINTGNEYPEIVKFVRSFGDVTFLRPKMTFEEVLCRVGYPLFYKEASQYIEDIRKAKPGSVTIERRLSNDRKFGVLAKKLRFMLDAPFLISDKCCYILKKHPAQRYENLTKNAAFIGVKAYDSKTRTNDYLQTGCNDITRKRPISRPLAIWTNDDIKEYIRLNGLNVCEIYNKGYERTGCVLCGFGCLAQKYPNNFQRLQITHPKMWAYGMDRLGFRDALTFATIPFEVGDYRIGAHGKKLFIPMTEEQIIAGNREVEALKSLVG